MEVTEDKVSKVMLHMEIQVVSMEIRGVKVLDQLHRTILHMDKHQNQRLMGRAMVLTILAMVRVSQVMASLLKHHMKVSNLMVLMDRLLNHQ